MLRLLLAAGAPALDEAGDDAVLRETATRGDVPALRLLVEHGADVNAAHGSGYSPLAAAAAHGQIEALRYLLQAGAEADRPNPAGITPLMVAADSGWHEYPRPPPSPRRLRS